MMENKLIKIFDRMLDTVESIEHKGNNNSQFLYVMNNGKAVEISLDENNYLWVEFWRDLNEESVPIYEKTFKKINEMEIELQKWFSGSI